MDLHNMSHSENQHDFQPQRMKVLLVEDSILLRDTMMDILEGAFGLQFDGHAATEAEAIELLRQQAYDMLILDIELAQGNGFEVLKATQSADYPYPKPVYIIFTNHAYPQYRLLAKQLGVEHFFDKSMDFDTAMETIEEEARKFAEA
jgi:DNA-binding NarL/FixJ family response regulator